MKTINLRDFYSTLYNQDAFYDVPDEVAELLILYQKKEKAQREYIRYHKAYYSLDRNQGIENAALSFVQSPEELYVFKIVQELLYSAMSELTDKQLERLYAHFFLGMSYAKIAHMQGVDRSTVRQSVKSALSRLKKKINNFV